ncbi:MAG: hypothetical protein GY711_08020 [bacterium]|nr:hypothetical protein [bacterium]
MKSPIIATALLASSCATTVSETSVEGNFAVLDQYNFRGVPQNEEGVVQADWTSTFTRESGDSFYTSAWANFDMKDDVGDAVLPGDAGGTASEIDLIAGYSRELDGVGIDTGIIHYAFPGGGSSTSELYVGATWALSIGDLAATIYYDVDIVGGLYGRVDLSRDFEIDEATVLSTSAGVAWSDSDHSEAYYGASESDLADFGASVAVNHTLDEATTVGLQVTYTSILGDDLADAVDDAGIEEDNVFAGITLSWSH